MPERQGVMSAPVRHSTSTRRPGPDPADSGQVERLLSDLRRLPADSPARERIRSQIVTLFMPHARHIARRYAARGEPMEDLHQSALLGLVKAINGYDPDLGDRFMPYAQVVMSGEVKRHFRDKTWLLRMPRRLQELRIVLRRVVREFVSEHGRNPRVAEIADLMDISEEEAKEVINASEAYRPLSLDTPVADTPDSHCVGDLVGGDDLALETVPDRQAVWPLIDELPERERSIILMRFFGNQTQSQIAEQMGISQMHVSRLIARTLKQLRNGLLAGD